jgi:predicted  nucleic acid-binding Zn-ribbon protein
MEAIKMKLKLQQEELASLRESHTQMERNFQDKEERMDKELAIVLRKVNQHFEQIHALNKEIHRT